jgi:2-polyprenyl-6-methoxyphenol hydroxylase-like FAD-dependent oxidoreductase
VSHDVLVIGAGPAGSVAARRLAAAGARVALVGAAARAGWEGLSRRSVALLAEEGLDGKEGFDGAEGLERVRGIIDGPYSRSGEWGGRAVEGTEWLVGRRALADGLRARACAAGVDDRRDTVTDLGWEGGRWLARLRAGGMLAAPQVIDARGRRGPERHGPLLLAVGRQFRTRFRHAAAAPAQPGTHLHAIDFGWCWWAARADALWVQVVGRPRGTRPAMALSAAAYADAGHPAAWIAAAAAQVPALARALEGSLPDGNLVARPAHARLGLTVRGAARDTARDTMRWLVGDAALALDPLSGQGVYEALRGARLVATAVQSVMRGGDAAPAHRFVTERQQESWASGVRTAAGFHRENVDRGSFWSQIAAAYERLLPSAAPSAPRVERRPVLCGGLFQERDVIVTSQHPRGVWHVADVPLVSLKGYLESAEHATVTGAAAAVDRPAAAVASAIHWLQQTGVVAREIRPGASSGG